MFTEGRIIFVIFFVVVFVGALVWAYRKDISVHRKSFSKSWMILVFVIIFLAVFIFLKRKFIGV